MECLDTSLVTAERPVAPLTDAFGRVISYLRLSVTDHCNLRCLYCMGKEVKFLPKSEVLTLEEMARLCDAFVRLGVRKIRLTGGEPLLRPGVEDLIAHLGEHRAAGRLDELTLTTNGTLLAQHAPALAAAGVRRVNVSLDTLNAATFTHITQQDGLDDVLEGIDMARSLGISVRVNLVALAGINDMEFDRLIQWCGDHDCDLAMIESMPMGGLGNDYYLPLDMVLMRLSRRWTFTQSSQSSLSTGGPCQYWDVAETGRRVGFITPMSHAFCAHCNRVRVNCSGSLVTCLARHNGVDLRPELRSSTSSDVLEQTIRDAVAHKPASHRFATECCAVETQKMWQLGG